MCGRQNKRINLKLWNVYVVSYQTNGFRWSKKKNSIRHPNRQLIPQKNDTERNCIMFMKDTNCWINGATKPISPVKWFHFPSYTELHKLLYKQTNSNNKITSATGKLVALLMIKDVHVLIGCDTDYRDCPQCEASSVCLHVSLILAINEYFLRKKKMRGKKKSQV